VIQADKAERVRPIYLIVRGFECGGSDGFFGNFGESCYG